MLIRINVDIVLVANLKDYTIIPRKLILKHNISVLAVKLT